MDAISLWNEGGKSAIIGLGKIIFVFICLIFVSAIVVWAIFRHIRKRAVQKAKLEVESIGKKAINEIEKNGAGWIKELDAKIAELKKAAGK